MPHTHQNFPEMAPNASYGNENFPECPQINLHFPTCPLRRQVVGNELFVTGKYVYQQYLDLQDAGYYLSTEQIIDMVVVPLPSPTDASSGSSATASAPAHAAILACQDRFLRLLICTKNKSAQEVCICIQLQRWLPHLI